MKTFVRTLPIVAFFPPDVPVTPVVAAFLMRVDELRILTKRYKCLVEDEDETRERTYFLFSLLRYATIAIHDAADLHKKVLKDSQFSAAMNGMHMQSAQIDASVQRLSRAMKSVSHIRNQCGAHIQIDHVRKTLEANPDLLGNVDLSDYPSKRRWGALHGVLGAMINKRASSGFSAETLGAVIDHCNEATAAVLELETPTVIVYDAVTKGSLLQVK